MTEFIKFEVPLCNLSFSLNVKQDPTYNRGWEGPKLYSAEILIKVSEEGPFNKVIIDDLEAWQRLTEEMQALNPQPNKIYSGELRERATKRRVEVVIREVQK